MIAWLMGSRIGRALGAAAAALAAVVGVYLTGRRAGAEKAAHKATQADQKRAKTIEEKADAARVNSDGNADERLRKHDAFRD